LSWKFNNVIPNLGTITEGPCWDGEKLLFSNIANNRILSYNIKNNITEEVFKDTGQANGLNFNINGELFACEGGRRRIARYNNDGSKDTIVDQLDGIAINSPNDLAINKKGEIYFSDRVGDINPDIGLNFSAIISAQKQEDGTYKSFRRTIDTSMPNGLLFNEQEDILYVAQSDYRADHERELRSYKVNIDGTLSDMKTLHDFGPHRGIDGMTLAKDSISKETYIVAATGWEISGPKGNITIFDKNGKIIERHETPCQRPTNCTIVENNIYVTSIEGHLLVAKTELEGLLIFPN
jgi:gluconolactonase